MTRVSGDDVSPLAFMARPTWVRGAAIAAAVFVSTAVTAAFVEDASPPATLPSGSAWEVAAGEAIALRASAAADRGRAEELRRQLGAVRFLSGASDESERSVETEDGVESTVTVPPLPVVVAASVVNGELEVYGRAPDATDVASAGVGDMLGGWTVVGSDLKTVQMSFGNLRESVDIRASDDVGARRDRQGRR